MKQARAVNAHDRGRTLADGRRAPAARKHVLALSQGGPPRQTLLARKLRRPAMIRRFRFRSLRSLVALAAVCG